jgi:hypothetical protein
MRAALTSSVKTLAITVLLLATLTVLYLAA